MFRGFSYGQSNCRFADPTLGSTGFASIHYRFRLPVPSRESGGISDLRVDGPASRLRNSIRGRSLALRFSTRLIKPPIPVDCLDFAIWLRMCVAKNWWARQRKPRQVLGFPPASRF